MSRVAPLVDVKTRAVVTQAHKLINDPKIGLDHPNANKFPAIKDSDPHNAMSGSFLAIEAKNVLIAAMVSGKWAELVKVNKKNVPNPADKDLNYDITQWELWPSSAGADGVVGQAADAQADVLAQLAFKHLVHGAIEASKKKKKPGKGRKSKTAATAEEPEEQGDEDADMPDVEGNVPAEEDDEDQETASRTNLSTAETATTPGFPPDDEDDTQAIPDPKSKPKNYRLTRDWEYWPSAGELPHECSNVQQAQYGLVSDVLFETMKIEMKPKPAKHGGKKKQTVEVDDSNKVALLTGNEVAMDILLDLLKQHAESGGKIIQSRGAKNGIQSALEFRDYVKTLDDIHYDEVDDEGDTANVSIHNKLNDLTADELYDLYRAIGKQFSKNKKAEVAKNKTAQPAQTEAAEESDPDDVPRPGDGRSNKKRKTAPR